MAYDNLIETFVELIRRASTELPADVIHALEKGKARVMKHLGTPVDE